MGEIIIDKDSKPGDYCCRCGALKKEIRRDRISCKAWGKNYPRHVYNQEKRNDQ